MRHKSRRAAAAILAALFFAACTAGEAPQAPQAQTAAGQISGAWEEGTAVFRGVPYAAPPTGAARWKPPAPPAAWEGVRAAAEYAPICRQPVQDAGEGFFALMVERLAIGWWRRLLIRAGAWLAGAEPQSEDCLYLNVRTRNFPPAAAAQPVMVWFHGGGHQYGSGSSPIYNTDALVKRGVVLVTVNYRLGVFGYLQHPALAAENPYGSSGNYGALDQIAALKWLRENAAAFGGDANNITIFGESAGAHSVGQLLASPLARGFFHKAIAQSGSGAGQFLHAKRPVRGLPSGESIGLQFAAALGITAPDESATAAAQTAAALRAQSADQVLAAAISRPHFSAGFHPNVDGRFLPHTVAEIFLARTQNKAPLLIGSNADEGTLLYPFFKVPVAGAGVVSTAEEWRAALAQAYRADAAALSAIYRAESDAEVDAAAEQFWGDATFGMPARLLAREHARSGARAYLYWFTRRPPNADATAGAYHAADIRFVFGSAFPFFPENEWDETLAQQMQRYWANFAYSGDPNIGPPTAAPAAEGAGDENAADELPYWPPFGAREGGAVALELGEQTRVVTPPREVAHRLQERELRRWISAAKAPR